MQWIWVLLFHISLLWYLLFPALPYVQTQNNTCSNHHLLMPIFEWFFLFSGVNAVFHFCWFPAHRINLQNQNVDIFGEGICMFIYLSVYIGISLFIFYLFIYISILYLYIYQPIHLFIYQSIYLHIHLFICLSTYPCFLSFFHIFISYNLTFSQSSIRGPSSPLEF